MNKQTTLSLAKGHVRRNTQGKPIFLEVLLFPVIYVICVITALNVYGLFSMVRTLTTPSQSILGRQHGRTVYHRLYIKVSKAVKYKGLYLYVFSFQNLRSDLVSVQMFPQFQHTPWQNFGKCLLCVHWTEASVP